MCERLKFESLRVLSRNNLFSMRSCKFRIAGQKYPAIVVAHPNGGVKEQTAGLYAQHLAEQGYITIAADAAYQVASGGEPRSVDKPANRIEDIHGMADFITRYPGVDAARLGLLHLRRRRLFAGGGKDRQTVQIARDTEHVQFRTGSSQRLYAIPPEELT
jgi:fermentation-respiration switch protein FrsA (DUF1100 family)